MPVSLHARPLPPATAAAPPVATILKRRRHCAVTTPLRARVSQPSRHLRAACPTDVRRPRRRVLLCYVYPPPPQRSIGVSPPQPSKRDRGPMLLATLVDGEDGVVVLDHAP